ncbi:MAG: mandelate racemase/muconate lactonizing enzyme family protein [Planctomycetota bacterium]|jgi:L-alanine-DL-glutamate epimerase-like enolase superfamily enzyme
MRIAKARALHRSAPVDKPVKTAFGVMNSRHAVILLLEDGDGRVGVGESWVNFPAWAPWERVAAFERCLIPYLTGREVEDVAGFVRSTWSDLVGQARQSGTRPALLCAISAVELALWDLCAQRDEKPLAALLFDEPAKSVRVYASGINAPLPWDLIDDMLGKGVTLFKLKLGFGDDEDRRNLEEMKRRLEGRASLAVDVNRGWDFDSAARWLPELATLDVEWIEEPLREEDEPRLGELAEMSGVPLAGGENVMTPPGSAPGELVGAPYAVLQPDLTKWAPLHVALDVLRSAAEHGKRVVPHFLGSGPGQAASLHFAAGCPDALCEVDINRNQLRTEMLDAPLVVEDGAIRIPDRPGLGWTLRETTDEHR